jgi:hypothetical protein
MKRRLHLIALALFVLSLLYNLVVWGALPRVPEVGRQIADSAYREAPLAATYVGLGNLIDAAVPALQAFGERRVTDAFGEGFERIRNDGTVAMDLILHSSWNSDHRWIKTMYWMPPLLLVITVILWLRRSRAVRTLGRR